MNLFVPDYIRSLKPYVPGKPIEETQREYGIRRVIKLASNENPLGPSPKALTAVQRHLADAHRYPDGSGYRLKQALSENLGVAPQSLILGNGSNEIIDNLIRTYCLAGDAIVTSQGAFIAYKISAQVHGVRALEAALTPDLRFDLPVILALTRSEPRARLVFIANPNNPTGTYVSAQELRSFLREVATIRGGNVLVALDYAYWEYVMASDLPDPLQLLKEFPNIVVLRTFSKIHGLAGLRVGYGIASAEIIADLEKVRMPFNVSSPGLVAAEAALGDRAFVQRARKLNEAGHKFWARALDRLGIPFAPSQGNFILADVRRGLGMSGPEVYGESLKRGVIFRPVANYGLPDYLRITLGTPEENRVAIDALARLKKGEEPGTVIKIPRRVRKAAKSGHKAKSGRSRRG